MPDAYAKLRRRGSAAQRSSFDDSDCPFNLGAFTKNRGSVVTYEMGRPAEAGFGRKHGVAKNVAEGMCDIALLDGGAGLQSLGKPIERTALHECLGDEQTP